MTYKQRVHTLNKNARRREAIRQSRALRTNNSDLRSVNRMQEQQLRMQPANAWMRGFHQKRQK